MRVKNWDRFQHFKERKPLWIKLYRELLDDHEWHKLDGESAKTLVMLWLLASEEKGELPSDTKELSFRLRIPEAIVIKHLSILSGWLIEDDIKLISDGYQVDALEKRREETEKRIVKRKKNDVSGTGFDEWYGMYPRKVSKQKAVDAWAKAMGSMPPLQDMLHALSWQKNTTDWKKEGGKYIPHPATYINDRRWEDEKTASHDLMQDYRNGNFGF